MYTIYIFARKLCESITNLSHIFCFLNNFSLTAIPGGTIGTGVDCGEPVVSSEFSLQEPIFTAYDSSVTCVCSPGYEPGYITSDDIKCLVDGTWSTLSLAFHCDREYFKMINAISYYIGSYPCLLTMI